MLEFLTLRSLTYISASYLLVLVLLSAQINTVLILFGLACVLLRVAIFTGRIPAINKLLTNSLAIVCSILVVSLVYSVGILDVLIHLIILGFSLTVLQLRTVRDTHFFVNTGFVLVALFLIYNHSIMMVSLAVLATLSLIVILVSIHGKTLQVKQQFKLLNKVLLLSFPLALVLFIVLPRLPAMWKMPLQKQATTGLSDSVTPGSIADLSQSPALAFRVSFNGELPIGQDRYWRVLTLDQFDGRTWTQSLNLKSEEKRAKSGRGTRYQLLEKQNSYQLILEPHYQHYLPSLDYAYSGANSVLLSDFSLRSIEPVYKRQAFEVEQYKGIQSLSGSAPALDQFLQLPKTGNPQTRLWLKEQLALGVDKFDILQQLLLRFRQDVFRYTLKPPLLGEQQVDDFLFSTKAGFCVHYASTYLFVARALNVPARMVTGYLGGEWEESEEFLTLRQYDAHAWVEIWQNNQWVRIDPTAYVSPDRIEKGVLQSLDDPSEFLSGQYLSLYHWQNNALFKQVRGLLARADYLWAVWVINYDNKKQLELLTKLVKKVPWLNLSMMILLLLVMATAIIMLWVFKPWQGDSLQLEDRVFNKLYKKAGEPLLHRNKGQTVSDYCTALAQKNKTEKPHLLEFALLYNQIKYQASLSVSGRKELIHKLKLLSANIINSAKKRKRES